ncbi:hypothetical protein L7F22_054503 [Adiantum nelumboides]|nr:hypothetical protein [Adiantum nelumboides]
MSSYSEDGGSLYSTRSVLLAVTCTLKMITMITLAAAAANNIGPYGGVDQQAEAAWLAAFPHLPLPSTVLLEESPLTSQQSSSWSMKLASRTVPFAQLSAQESSQLCSEARLLCTPTPRLRSPLPDDTDYLPGDWIIYSESAPSKDVEPIPPGRFFKLEQLSERATMILPNLNHPVSSTPYLPHALAQHLPVNTPTSIPSFLSLLGISNSSAMGYVINGIIQRCSKKEDPQGQVKRCAASIEGMISFVEERLGNAVQVLESQPTPQFLQSATSNMVTVKSLISRSTSTATNNVVCHKLLFPSMLRGCHELASTKVYEAQLQIHGYNHGNPTYAVAVCHFDTSKWNAAHPSFHLLKMSPGKGTICHWIRADEHVWLRV